jgi:hypothetical protein
VPHNVVTLLRDSSGAVKGSGGADGTGATVRVKEYDPHEAAQGGELSNKKSWYNGDVH